MTHTRKVRAGRVHHVDTSLLAEGATCTVAGRCTHDCDEGRSCSCSKPESRAERARVWCWYIFPVMLVTALAWVAVAVWLWRMA